MDCLAVRPADRPGAREIEARFERYASGRSSAAPRAAAGAPVGSPAGGSPETPARTAVLPAVAGPDRHAVPRRPAPPLRKAETTEPTAAHRPVTPRAARARALATRRSGPTSGPLLGLAGLVVAAAMSMPVAAGVLLFLLLTTARTTDSFLSGLRWRRELGGRRGRAVTLQLLASPWSAATAALGALASMVLPALSAAGTTYVARQLIPMYSAGSSWTANLAVGIGAAAGLLVLRFGPGGRTNRRAAHTTLRAVAPSQNAALALTGALALAVAAILLVVWRYPVLDWWPLDRPPTRGL
jgi:hypothetical protein